MAIPSLKAACALYAGNRGFVTAMYALRPVHGRPRGHKKASRIAPARPALPPPPDRPSRWRYDGIRTVSTTWITPFDCLTFGIVTVEEPPLESMIITVSPDRFTVNSSPSTVLSVLPSVRSEA